MSGSQPSPELAQAAQAHRSVAAMVVAADRAGVATAELPAVRARLSAQAPRLATWAMRTGAPAPSLAPSPSEIAQAGPALGDLSESASVAAVRVMESTLDAADTALSAAGIAPTVDTHAGRIPPAGTAPVAFAAAGAGEPPAPVSHGHIPSDDQPTQRPQWQPPTPALPTPPALPSAPPAPSEAAHPSTSNSWLTRGVYVRNTVVYGAYAAVVFGVQMLLFLLLDETTLPAAAPACLLVLPALAWAAGYLTIGAVFQAPPHGKLDRTPRLGVLVSVVPNGLLCGILGLLFVTDAIRA